jgi:ornithine cyclodeaminase/alanine dehydrogenase
MLALSHSDILAVITLEDVIEAVEAAHGDLARGTAVQPTRSALAFPNSPTLIVPMTAASQRAGVAAVKVLADVPSNGALGLPVQQSTIILVDLATGRCEAILDGGSITLFRTAAASAVATRHLARHDSRTLGLVGAGAQARTHLAAIRSVRPIDRVLVWSRSRLTAQRFVIACRDDIDVDIKVVDNPRDAVTPADIVCTLTPSKSPLVRGSWLRAGVHINVVGSPPRPDFREVDTDAVRLARVIVDSYDTVVRESGDMLIPVSEGAISPAHFAHELGDVIIGNTAGRDDPRQITMYKSMGVGIQDAVAAALVLERAQRLGIGTDITLTRPPPAVVPDRSSAAAREV